MEFRSEAIICLFSLNSFQFVFVGDSCEFSLSSGSQSQKQESVLAKPLKDQAFASPDKVAEIVQKVCHVP